MIIRNELSKLAVGIACCLAIMHVSEARADACDELAGTEWHWISQFGSGAVEAHLRFVKNVPDEIEVEFDWAGFLTAGYAPTLPVDAQRVRRDHITEWTPTELVVTPVMGGTCMVEMAWSRGLPGIEPYAIRMWVARDVEDAFGYSFGMSGLTTTVQFRNQTP